MKSFLFFPVVALLFHALSWAERKPVALGLMGGLNTSTLWGDNSNAFDEQSVWPIAAFSLAVNLPELLGIEMDLMYASRGSSFSSPADTGNYINTVKIHTLTVPLLLKITAPIGTEAQPIFFGGPAIAYFASKGFASEKIYMMNGTVESKTVIPLISPENMRDYEILLVLGAGVEWWSGTVQCRINLAQGSLDTTKKMDIKTLTIDLLAGFVF